MWEFITANLGVILTTLAYTIAGVITVIKLVKNNTNVKLNSTTFKNIVAELPNLITMAEKINGLDGASKKAFVMQQVKLLINATGITASEEDINSLSLMIDNLVSLSKSINTHSKTVNTNNINTVTGV